MKQFLTEVSDKLKSYVYLYSDPRNGKAFYVGKGKRNRCFNHLGEKGEARKVRKINQIRRAGLKPKIEILRFGLNDSEAMLIEASMIDLLGLKNLTNEVKGKHSDDFGRNSVEEISLQIAAKPAKFKHDAILITINQLFEKDMTPTRLLEATRGIWVVGKKREEVKIAMAVYHGIVREVYRIEKWLPAGTQHYRTRPDINEIKKSRRWEFRGKVAEEKLRKQYLHKSVHKGGQNPIRYVKC